MKSTKHFLLWEKETKNPKEGRLTTEAMEKED